LARNLREELWPPAAGGPFPIALRSCVHLAPSLVDAQPRFLLVFRMLASESLTMMDRRTLRIIPIDSEKVRII
jgi:hypothetical protein